ncbi:hypothetical protein [uncultured Pseudodesulfovibrio sp.]|uniref:hypothetical protein n=1 Tax=uncultured Pseudodesulfovibrio sp. TaxID=2035858 RepID=UPI0029C63E3C|nr:hypothetical protein [uncultured Pseudodesulfovibrio sp.]
MKYVNMINEKVNVEEESASKGFSKGEKREDYADSWKGTGNVVLVGLPGSGKAELASLLAERTRQEVITPADASEAVAALGREKTIIVLADELVEDDSVQPKIHGAGKVFYLMADSNTLSTRVAEREGASDRESLWRDMSARLAIMEPVFYSVLHFIMQAAETPESLMEDALEKIAF